MIYSGFFFEDSYSEETFISRGAENAKERAIARDDLFFRNGNGFSIRLPFFSWTRENLAFNCSGSDELWAVWA